MLSIKEIFHRKGNFLLGLVGMVIAVGLVVGFIIMTKASQNETRRLTRDMGFNLRIVPKETDMGNFWISGFSEKTMPQDYVDVLVKEKSVFYAHLTATLHKRIELNNREVVLTGISPDEVEPSGKKKSKMIFAIEPGAVYVGYEIAKVLDVNKRDSIDILGQKFVVSQTLSETGSEDDIRLYLDLGTLQSLLKMEGRINEIMALNCMCSTEGDDPLENLRVHLSSILPNTKVIMNRTIAVARERQRKMVDGYFAILLPVMLIICMVWIGVFAMLNVNSRRNEIGIMRALGFGTERIAMLFFSRAIITGLIGALLGYFAGVWLAMEFGPEIFKVTAKSIKPDWDLLWIAVVSAPLFASVSSFIPIMWAISSDPAKLLKEE
jgi:ABC-type lipoprotein release transport system permease subunit